VGTERIVEHIEKFVCPTITSVDFLGGSPFRFRHDRRSILMMIGEDEYKTETTLPQFAKDYLGPHGFQVKIIHADATDKNDFPGLVEALPQADVLLVSVRRRPPKAEQLAAVRAHLAAGKPVVGIRTASHAFSLRSNVAPEAGYAAWTSFDQEILGGNYVGHHGNGPRVETSTAPGAAAHPILVGIDPTKIGSAGSLYKVVPLMPSTTPVLMGTIPGFPVEPVAWTNSPRVGGSRVFYTSLGHADDFGNAAFCKLLLQGLCWTIDNAPPACEQTKE
jgi:type 1 glutamine amidotransferase